MLTLPWRDREKWKGIPGNEFKDNYVGRNIAPDSIFSFSDLEVPFLFKERRNLARQTELLNEDSVGHSLIWTLQANKPYKAALPFLKIPNNCYAIISPRSILSEMGIICPSSSIVNPGFIGHPVMLMLPTLCVQIEPGVELFSIRIFQEEGLRSYHGFYQKD